MFSVLWAVANLIADLFKSHRRLEVENLLLRLQLSVALRQAPARLRLRGIDRAILAGLVGLWPDLARVVQVVKPDTIFRCIGWGPEPIGAGNSGDRRDGRKLTGDYGI